MSYKINVDDPVPSFEAKDQHGHLLSDRKLRGKPFVLYFYPKDGTSVCTEEACSFRDNLNAFKTLGVPVIGVSPDSMDSHKQFAAEHELNFSLIADEGHKLAKQFDVWRSNAIERTTFLINADGIISWIERRVDVNGHVGRIQSAIKEINSKTAL